MLDATLLADCAQSLYLLGNLTFFANISWISGVGSMFSNWTSKI